MRIRTRISMVAALLGATLGLSLAAMSVTSLAWTATAGAQPNCIVNASSSVNCTTPAAPQGAGQSVSSAQVTSQPAEPAEPGGLAFTGADIAGMAVIGLAALGAGSLLLAARRRHAVGPA